MNGFRSIFLFVGVVISGWNTVQAQDFEILAGPIYGHYTDSTRNFWLAVAPHQEQAPYAEWISSLNADLYAYFNVHEQIRVKCVTRSKLVLNRYVLIQGIVEHQPAPKKNKNLSFLLGSCAFPYPFMFWKAGDRELIFDVMTEQDKDFMIWMGDNVYYLNGEWRKKQKMHQKNLRMRFNTRLDKFLKSCPQYAIWDDHDFGGNNARSQHRYKYESLELFKQYWNNPYFGLDTTPGVFCHFSQEDADFFLLDSRFHAKDSSMLGASQTQWLFEKLKQSTASFKFIVSGTQILPDNPSGEDMGDFGNEREKLLAFLAEEKITGVIFLSGDRHYGELLRLERSGTYPLYEMTSSPLTSFVNPGYTRDNPLREPETLAVVANFGKIELIGEGKERFCRLALFGKTGQLLWSEEINLVDLQ
ncbi:MAG: alkaline phosphatase D family protein [Aureispira sp.]